MRLLTLVSASALTALVVAAPVAADDARTGQVENEDVIRWEDFEDPSFSPTGQSDAPVAHEERRTSRADSIKLGPMGVDANGLEGRVHTVAEAETLWDISEAYLGTPWVWPSVWNENTEIENPHLIRPGDRIWITSTEMRHVTDREAEELLSAQPTDTDVADTSGDGDDSTPPVEDELEVTELVPAAVEDETPPPLAEPLPAPVGPVLTGDIIVIPQDQDANFTTADVMETAASIVDAPTRRAFLTQGDEVHLALGEGEVAVGDQFTVFRDVEPILDRKTGRTLGYHLNALGWLQVHAIDGEASIAVIHEASGEIARGDKLVPREVAPREVAVVHADGVAEGEIVYTPGYRCMMGSTDSVYLNVGSEDGIEVGTALEVFVRGDTRSDGVRADRVKLPDSVIAQIVVISVRPETSVAFVAQTKRELTVGDAVRGAAAARYAAR